MGTYTTNYNLFMPSIGEQGWGELVNGNFTTIDTTMSGLNARVGTLETEADAVETTVTAIEQVVSNGNVNSSNINNSGSITTDSVTGKTANFESYNISSQYDSGIIGAIYVPDHEIFNVTSNTTQSFTWKKSKLHVGIIRFVISAYRYDEYTSITLYVNNKSVGTASSSTNYTGASKTIDLTLNDGDIVKIVASGSTHQSSGGLRVVIKGFYI